MGDQLKKALEVAKRTGDRVIIVDSSDPQNKASVIMNIDEYEKMLSYKENYREDIKGLTEEQLIDKINSDIALWKEEEQEEEMEDLFPSGSDLEEDMEEESMYYYPEIVEDHPEVSSEEKEETSFEEGEEEDIFEKFTRQQQELSQEEDKNNEWKIPFDVKEGAEEVKEE